MSAYMGTLFVHITAAVLLLGTSIVGEPVVRAAARRTGSRQELRAYLEIGRRMSMISPVAALAVLASGIGLSAVLQAWTLGWVQLSLALWFVNSVVAVAVVKAAVQQIGEGVGVAPEAPVDEELNRLRWSARWSWGGDALAVNDAVVLWLMVAKPTLAGALTTVVVAYAVAAGFRIAFGRPPALEDGSMARAAVRA